MNITAHILGHSAVVTPAGLCVLLCVGILDISDIHTQREREWF